MPSSSALSVPINKQRDYQHVVINAEEIVLAVPEVSDPSAGGIPGHTVGVRQGIFIFLSSAPRSRLGSDPRVSPAGISTRITQEMPQEVSPESPEPPSARAGRKASCNSGTI